MPPAKKKYRLPEPVYSTDVYLAAVLEELCKLNELMESLTKRPQQAPNTVAKSAQKKS